MMPGGGNACECPRHMLLVGQSAYKRKRVCAHVWACSWSMCVYGLDPLRVNHGDMGPGTLVRKAALRNLGNQ